MEIFCFQSTSTEEMVLDQPSDTIRVNRMNYLYHFAIFLMFKITFSNAIRRNNNPLTIIIRAKSEEMEKEKNRLFQVVT